MDNLRHLDAEGVKDCIRHHREKKGDDVANRHIPPEDYDPNDDLANPDGNDDTPEILMFFSHKNNAVVPTKQYYDIL